MAQQRLRFAVRVRPGAPREAVGGRWDGGAAPGKGGRALGDGAAAPALRVSVTAAAADGKANEAVREAIAKAFGVRKHDVRLVTGERSRNKLIEIDPAPAGATTRLTALLAGGG